MTGRARVIFAVSTGTEHGAVAESRALLSGLRATVAGYVLTRAVGGRRYRSHGRSG